MLSSAEKELRKRDLAKEIDSKKPTLKLMLDDVDIKKHDWESLNKKRSTRIAIGAVQGILIGGIIGSIVSIIFNSTFGEILAIIVIISIIYFAIKRSLGLIKTKKDSYDNAVARYDAAAKEIKIMEEEYQSLS